MMRSWLLAVNGDESTVVRRGKRLLMWGLLEEGIGWLEVKQPRRALDCFEAALSVTGRSPLAELGRAEALGQLGRPITRFVRRVQSSSTRQERGIPWADAEPEAARLEEQRAFAEALAVYRSVRPAPQALPALFAARARCHLHLREHGLAIDYAQRAITAEPSHTPARVTLIRALLGRDESAKALRYADELVTLVPDQGVGHYLRGRSLLALGRLADARASFERACALDPTSVEAMLLRREVVRAMHELQQRVGSDPTAEAALPAHLADLRMMLTTGDPRDAIAALSAGEYASDPVARVLLGRFLLMDGRAEEALTVFESVAGAGAQARQAALLGRATALLQMDRADESREVFARLRAEAPDDIDAIAGHAHALERLGRHEDAAEAYRRMIAMADDRSDLRVRFARLWLARQRS